MKRVGSLHAALAIAFAALGSAAHAGITVTKARIGCLDIQTDGNLTALVARACNGRMSCSYKAPTEDQYRRAGVRARTRSFCTQAMEIAYHCGRQRHRDGLRARRRVEPPTGAAGLRAAGTAGHHQRHQGANRMPGHPGRGEPHPARGPGVQRALSAAASASETLGANSPPLMMPKGRPPGVGSGSSLRSVRWRTVVQALSDATSRRSRPTIPAVLPMRTGSAP